jgi:hypothetical protein
MGLAGVDGVAAQGVNDIEVMTEHVRVLVIFGVYVLADGGGQGEVRRLAKR